MEVIWSSKAYFRAEEIAVFLAQTSLQSAENFYDNLDKAIRKISKYPAIGQPSAKEPGVRSWKIDRHRRLFYEADEDARALFLLDVFDSRQHPEKSNY